MNGCRPIWSNSSRTGSPDSLRRWLYQPDQFRTLVVELDRRGYQLMTHATRFDTVHMVLDAYEEAERSNGPRDRRLRIEHSSSVRDARFPALCRAVGDQCHVAWLLLRRVRHERRPQGADPERSVADLPQERRGAGIQQRTGRVPGRRIPSSAFRRRSHAKSGIPTIRPTSSICPWTAPHWRVRVPPARSIPLNSASACGRRVDAYTQGSAYASFADTPSRQPWRSESSRISPSCLRTSLRYRPGPSGKTTVLLTMVGGRIVHGTPP